MVKETKNKKPKISKEEREEILKPFRELENKGFDQKSFEEKNYGKTLAVKEEQIQKYFSETSEQQNPAKELFDVKGDIRTRTQLSKSQVSGVVKLYFLANELNMPELKKVADNFMHCQVSLERQSRKEFVETMKNNNELQQGGGFFNKFRGIFNNGQ